MIIKNYRENPEIIKEVSDLYKSAFPAAERAPFFHLRRYAKNSFVDFCALYDKDKFVGFYYSISNKDIVYVFYLAIAPEFRGSGYGSEMLEIIKKNNVGKRIILNIEEVKNTYDNYEQRKKRKSFYERAGFNNCGVVTKEAGIVLEMLSFGGKVKSNEYKEIMTNLLGSFFVRLLIKFY